MILINDNVQNWPFVLLAFKEESWHTYIFSGKIPWMNKKTNVNKRSCERVEMMVEPDKMKL